MDSPLGQLVYYGTNYAPQIMTAVMDMSSNGNIEMVCDDGDGCDDYDGDDDKIIYDLSPIIP